MGKGQCRIGGKIDPEFTTPEACREANGTWEETSDTGDDNSSLCFIATATYGSPMAVEVLAFRQCRDEVLLPSPAGSRFVQAYYRISPPFARLIARFPFLKHATRYLLLDPTLFLLKRVRRNPH